MICDIARLKEEVERKKERKKKKNLKKIGEIRLFDR